MLSRSIRFASACFVVLAIIAAGCHTVPLGDPEKSHVDAKLNGRDIALNWEGSMYHTPQDDMKQPLNFDAAVKCVRVNLAVGFEVAQEDGRPQWNAGDFFQEKFGGK